MIHGVLHGGNWHVNCGLVCLVPFTLPTVAERRLSTPLGSQSWHRRSLTFRRLPGAWYTDYLVTDFAGQEKEKAPYAPARVTYLGASRPQPLHARHWHLTDTRPDNRARHRTSSCPGGRRLKCLPQRVTTLAAPVPKDKVIKVAAVQFRKLGNYLNYLRYLNYGSKIPRS